MAEQEHRHIGPFTLGSVIGHGGMGVVFRAIHTLSGVDVALKVVTGHLSRSDDYRDAFQLEVEAMAGLEHPGILTVYDYGVVEDGAAAAAGDLLAPQSPWFAMELANDGNLGSARVESWLELRKVLIEAADSLTPPRTQGSS
jgi:serine/threonine protein kinase